MTGNSTIELSLERADVELVRPRSKELKSSLLGRELHCGDAVLFDGVLLQVTALDPDGAVVDSHTQVRMHLADQGVQLRCSECRAESPADQTFCGSCGSPLPVIDLSSPHAQLTVPTVSVADRSAGSTPRAASVAPSEAVRPEPMPESSAPRPDGLSRATMMKILGGMAALIVLIPVVRSFTNDDAAEPGARQVPVVTQRDTPADDSFEELIVFDSITAGRRTFTLDLPNNYAAVYVSFHVANTPDDILKYGPWASTLDVNGVRVMEWIEFDGVDSLYTTIDNSTPTYGASGKGQWIDITSVVSPGSNDLEFYHFNEGPGFGITARVVTDG